MAKNDNVLAFDRNNRRSSRRIAAEGSTHERIEATQTAEALAMGFADTDDNVAHAT